MTALLRPGQLHEQPSVEASAEWVTLYRAVGPGQLKAIEASGWKKFPARLHWQRYFYPMLHESFAHKIASQWNVQQSGVGYVLSFKVRKDYLQALPVYILGGPEHREYRIPCYELDAFNDNIIGDIEVLASYSETSKLDRGFSLWSQPLVSAWPCRSDTVNDLGMMA